MKRRDFLMSVGALAATPMVGLQTAAQAADATTTLVAEPVTTQLLPLGNPATAMLGINGSSPGPLLRMKQGERQSIRFDNQIDQGSALHWHGLRIDNAMDGVPGLTQDLVQPKGGFDYILNPPDAGTFWYHSHNRSWEQVARGLYGPIIVEESSPPDVDRDIVVMVDDWRLTQTGALAPGYDNMHDQAHQGRLGNYARALFDDEGSVQRGQRLRLRLINVATDRVFPLKLAGVEGQVVALDGMPLSKPRPLTEMLMAPAQRVDIIADVVSDEAVVILAPLRDGEFSLGELAVKGAAQTPRTAGIAPLPAHRLAQPDLVKSEDILVKMEGGAMNPRMMALDSIWALGGRTGLDQDPVMRIARGKTARMRLANETLFPHGIHLHGHHFYELAADGSLGDLRDTTLIMPEETREIVCVFDNPGKWLLHCHMLGHQAAGMKTWVEVT